MSIKDDDVKLSRWCFSCKQKGYILVRIVKGEHGTEYKLKNFINHCTNRECFRYAEKIPENWEVEYGPVPNEAILGQSRNKWQRGRSDRQSFAEDQTHEKPVLDAKSTEIPEMEESYLEPVLGSDQGSRSGELFDEEYRDEGEAVWDT